MNSAQTPLKVLVVDDVPQNLLAMTALLASPGVEVLTAEAGPAALELLLGHDVALALLDVQMPGMDGYALAELMRGTERTRHVPIIFLTAAALDEQRSFRGYESGAVDFLHKPIDTAVLRSKVAVFCDLHRQRVLLAERMAELERLQRLNSQMQSALTHDIRAPLAALHLNAELLARRADIPGLAQTSVRIKAAAAMLGRQVDHLVNLATLPSTDLRPQLQPGDLSELVLQRIELAKRQGLVTIAPSFAASGDPGADYDPALLAEAVDHLLLQAATYAGDAPLRLALDGSNRRSLQLSVAFEGVLPDAAAHHLFGPGVAIEGMATPRVGVGLQAADRIVRAHGGSVIGRSRPRDGTLLELVLPRGVAQAI